MKNVLVPFFSFLFVLPLVGQHIPPQFTVPVSVALPFNEFAEVDSENKGCFGLGAELNLAPFRQSPIHFGVSFRYFWMGTRSREVTITDSLGSIDVSTRVTGSMIPLHAFARLDLMNIYHAPVLPYAGGFVGARFFNVRTRSEVDYRDGNEPFDEVDYTVNTTLSYGFQIGLHIKINSYLLLDARWERAYGGEAEYLDASSIEIDDKGYAAYELHKTRTDVDIFTVGLVISLPIEKSH